MLAALNSYMFDLILLPFVTMLASEILYDKLNPSIPSNELSLFDLFDITPDSLFGDDSKKAVKAR